MFISKMQREYRHRSLCFFLSLYQQRCHPFPIRRDNCRFKFIINHFAGFCTGRLFHVFDDGIVHRHQRRIPGTAVIGGDNCSLLQRSVGNLFSIRDHNRMGSWNLLGMEPHVIVVRVFQRQPVILNIIPPHQYGKPVGRTVFHR